MNGNLGVSFDSLRLDVADELLEKLELVEDEPVDEVVENNLGVLFENSCCLVDRTVFGVSFCSLSIVEVADSDSFKL